MGYELSARSMQKLQGVHKDLYDVVLRAAETTHLQFQVTEGVRTIARQRELFRQGASRTMDSRHLTGHAVDLAVHFDFDSDRVLDAGELSWKFRYYKQLAHVMQLVAEELEVALEWGGDWKGFSDGPHFQLPWSVYPA